MLNFFVTGTDTDVGKTLISAALLKAFAAHNMKCVGYKPISAGCTLHNGQLENEDAVLLKTCGNVDVSLSQVNPIAFEPPIAPHIAASEVQQSIDVETLHRGIQVLKEKKPDVLLTEGAGGWLLPINRNVTLADVIEPLDMQIVIVFGMRLGCLNHALLTVEAIQSRGFKIAGWVANHLSTDMPYAQQNIETLCDFIDAPLLGEVPYFDGANSPMEKVALVQSHIDISPLIK
ncbi:dethiobiotin synthase [Alteromonas facilis]|uniref:dethiobiotin synthase n=1 Tax=Alteromonas facilis TaxID=2048004 RepID=UPI000C287D70|nr:dethiobiotin synthase [Alteromonas facilis]